MPANACSFSFFILFFSASTVLFISISTEKGLSDLLRIQQKRLNLSSEPKIERFMGLTAIDCLLWDGSDRLESIDQVEAMVAGAD